MQPAGPPLLIFSACQPPTIGERSAATTTRLTDGCCRPVPSSLIFSVATAPASRRSASALCTGALVIPDSVHSALILTCDSTSPDPSPHGRPQAASTDSRIRALRVSGSIVVAAAAQALARTLTSIRRALSHFISVVPIPGSLASCMMLRMSPIIIWPEQGLDHIPRPTAIAGMPDPIYRQLDGLSGTEAADIIRPGGPARIHWRRTHPHTPTPQMILGTAIHAAALQGVMPADCGPTRRGGAWRDAAAQAVADGRTPLTTGDYDTCMAVADAVHAHPAAAALLDPGPLHDLSWTELTLAAGAGTTGQPPTRGRADIIHVGEHIVADLKTTGQPLHTVDDGASWRRGWHVQLGHYIRLAQQAGVLDGAGPDACIIAASTLPPYEVRLLWLDPDLLARGMEDDEHACRIYADACETGLWPGPQDGDLGIPRWAR